MGDRWERRKHNAETAAIIKKAKKDMSDWLLTLDYIPDERD